MAILRACTRCGALSDQARCPRHRPKDDRPSSARRGYGARWQATSERYRAECPVCECADPTCCPEGCQNPSAHVDHIDGRGPLGPRGYDPSNWRALCAPCHSRKTAREDGGFGRRRAPGDG